MTAKPVTETWAPIPGATNYEASTEGRIRSVTRTVMTSNGIPRLFRGQDIAISRTHGAPVVSIVCDGATGQRNRKVAALVLTTHVGPAPSAKHRPTPVNGDPQDTRLVNLRWQLPAALRPKPPKPVKTPKVEAPKPPRLVAPAPTEAVIDLTGLPTLNPNSRLHWSSRNRAVNEIRTVVALRARQAGIPTGLDHVHVEFHLRPTREWDDDNLWGAGLWKAAADALHARGKGWKHPVVADDTRQHMTRTPAVQHRIKPGEDPAAWLVIRWTLNAQEAS